MQSFLGHADQTCPMMEESEKESIKRNVARKDLYEERVDRATLREPC